MLATGSAMGTMETSEDIYLLDAPNIYFQDASADPFFNPDSDGFYWQLTGTASYPVYEVGCPTDVSFSENLTVNDVLCDNVGVKATVQQRNYMEFSMTVQSFFPLQTLRLFLKGGAVTETAPTQKFGFGKINNDQFWHLYAPKVYNEDVGDYLWIYLHKVQFVDAFSISMPFGSPWQISNLMLRAMADTTKPSAQIFGMFGRSDSSVIT